jgi:dihydroneopterin aldolase
MNAVWTVRIERLEVQLAVGIYPEEVLPQPIWVSLTASGMAPAAPAELDDCFDYEPLCHWLTQVWPTTSHTPLLETRINELIAYVFDNDPRVHEVWVGLYKQRVSRQSLAVGIERGATRVSYMAQRIQADTTQADAHTS